MTERNAERVREDDREDAEHRDRDEVTETDEVADPGTRQAERACPECGGDLERDEERGETVCSECGLVVDEDAVDRGPEWRAFDSAERDEKSRVGAPRTKLLHDEGLSTRIGYQDRDARGHLLSARKRTQMHRLRTWDERFRTRDARDRNLKQALAEIERMAAALGLPKSVRERAAVTYRRALREGLLLGRSIEGVATAVLYGAARQAETPRSLDEVATVSRVEREEIARTYRYVVRELDLEIAPADPAQYVPRIASALDLSEAVEREARRLLEAAAEAGRTSGKSPVGLAAAAIYAAAILANERVTQEAVADVADVSAVTIRNRYHELLEVATDEG
ncbi:MAG: transcription initiation factor IIB family protein [Halanaeroarchaeum sp.]